MLVLCQLKGGCFAIIDTSLEHWDYEKFLLALLFWKQHIFFIMSVCIYY